MTSEVRNAESSRGLFESVENEGEKEEMMEIDVVVQIWSKFGCWLACEDENNLMHGLTLWGNETPIPTTGARPK